MLSLNDSTAPISINDTWSKINAGSVAYSASWLNYQSVLGTARMSQRQSEKAGVENGRLNDRDGKCRRMLESKEKNIDWNITKHNVCLDCLPVPVGVIQSKKLWKHHNISLEYTAPFESTKKSCWLTDSLHLYHSCYTLFALKIFFNRNMFCFYCWMVFNSFSKSTFIYVLIIKLITCILPQLWFAFGLVQDIRTFLSHISGIVHAVKNFIKTPNTITLQSLCTTSVW